MISKETKDKILATADIVEVISDFVKLKKRGANYVGLCPFHNEKTPSFTVSPVKRIFKCFGCGKAGDVVTFIMEHEKLTYREALLYLAKKYGIEVEETEPDEQEKEKHKLRETLFALNEFALQHFKTNLHDTDYGKSAALPYLTERGIPDYLVEKFEIGLAMPGGREFVSHAGLKGYKPELLVQGGLAIKKGNDYADKFVNRIIFPIHNITGKIIGFGGRILGTKKDAPKYLNTQETEIFVKRYNLYGLYFAKKKIVAEDKCYLVEGYTDVIGFHKAGIENVVASLGTSLTVEQIIAVRRFTKNLVIVYDGDYAGIKASLRGIDLALNEGMNVKVVELPEGEDPDSISQKWSSSEIVDFLNSNENDFIVFKASILLKEAGNDPFKRSQAIHEILTSVGNISDKILRKYYLKEIADKFSLEERILIDELNKILYNKSKYKYSGADTNEETLKKVTPSLPVIVQGVDFKPQEEEIVKILLKFGDKKLKMPDGSEFYVADVVINEIKSDEFVFTVPVYKKIFEEYEQGQRELEHFINHDDEEIRKLTADILMSGYKLSKIYSNFNIYTLSEEERLYNTVISTIILLKIKILETERELLKKELKEAEAKKDETKMLDLIQRISRINNAILSFKKEL